MMKWYSSIKQLLSSPDCPFWLFQLPLFPYYLYLMIRSGSVSFFTACNPGLITGGLVNELKYDLLNQVPLKFRPLTLFATSDESATSVLTRIHEAGMDFPIIIKPNTGEKGWRVKKVNGVAGLKTYLDNNPFDILLQEFIDDPVELGVLFYRIPGSSEYGITSIGSKEMPSVTGNGVNTLGELVTNNAHFTRLVQVNNLDAAVVIPAGEIVYLDYIAHRNRGTVFKNASALITPDIIHCFKQITEGIEGFYFGRFDIKAKSLADFSENRQFKILEVNGLGGVPIHIFDPGVSVIEMYKALYHHWKLIYRISMVNHANHTAFMPYRSLLRELRKSKEQLKYPLL